MNQKLASETFKAYKSYKNLAKVYDPVTQVASLFLVNKWRNYMIERLPTQSEVKLLDAAGGQGAISLKLIGELTKKEFKGNYNITVCDICPPMMEVGKLKCQQLNYQNVKIDWVTGDIQNLPFPDKTFDVYTNCFGMRSVDLQMVTQEAYRVLKPGGQFLLLDICNSPHFIVRWLYRKYLSTIVPPVCHLIWNEKDALVYLADILNKIPNNEEVTSIIANCGFSSVSFKNLSFGIAAFYQAFKP